ncbi:MAG: LCP family protein [Acidimicrobiales bacterium]
MVDQGNGAGRPEGQPGRQSGAHRRRRRRRWPRRLLIGLNIVAILILVGAGSAYGYVHHRLDQIPRVAVRGITSPGSSGAASSGPAAGGGADPAPSAPSSPETFLLVGSDSRKGQNAKQFGSAAHHPGQRSDVIILVHLVPATHKAAMLSIPRDTLVKIAGTSEVTKINAAFNTGPSRLIETIHQDFGIAINHFVEVDFSGLQGVVNTVGGVCMHFPYPVRDAGPPKSPPGTDESGLKEPAGNQHLNGAEALSLVRSRFYQYYKDRSWHPEGTGDLGRIKRQHEFLRVLAEKAIKSGIHNPIKANSLVSQAVKDVIVGNGLSTSDILHLIGEFRSLRPSTIPSWTLPTKDDTTSAGYQGQLVIQPAARQTIAAWQAYGAVPAPTTTTTAPTPTTTPPTSPSSSSTSTTLLDPSQVSVKVLNGSGVSGQAGQAATGLRAAGFQVTTYGDAPSYSHPTSIVSYAAGQGVAAATVAAHVKGGATLKEDPSLPGTTVLLTTGASFGGVSPTALASSPASSTPAPSTTSTTSTTAPPAAKAPAPDSTKLLPWDPTPCSTGA